MVVAGFFPYGLARSWDKKGTLNPDIYVACSVLYAGASAFSPLVYGMMNANIRRMHSQLRGTRKEKDVSFGGRDCVEGAIGREALSGCGGAAGGGSGAQTRISDLNNGNVNGDTLTCTNTYTTTNTHTPLISKNSTPLLLCAGPAQAALVTALPEAAAVAAAAASARFLTRSSTQEFLDQIAKLRLIDDELNADESST